MGIWSEGVECTSKVREQLKCACMLVEDMLTPSSQQTTGYMKHTV